MRSATIEEAKEQLRELIDAARAGEDVEITDGGHQVAVLHAGTSGSVLDSEQRQLSPEAMDLVRRLQARGLMGPHVPVPDPSAIDELPAGDSGVLQALLDEREESW
jgi:antitoxin (DNA-binding transcriptional repressor) of toxin-antitoxin stability system